jgi:hypothetical protein
MTARLLVCLLPAAWAAALPVRGTDLSTIDRTIRKEPVYQTKAPRYCLLVFGPQAETRVWLVQDGDTLYIDRNGNGDLTDPGEKVAAAKQGAADGEYTFEAGEVRAGGRVHKALTVYVSKLDHLAGQDERVKAFLARNPKARGYYILVEVDMPGWKGTGAGGRVQQRAFYVDAGGILQFADRREDAPVIHFGGPWHVTLFDPLRLTIGRDTDVVLGVGTPGVGPGTTAYIDYGGVIPENVYPVVEVAYPPKAPGEPPVRERYELKRRC